MIKVFPRKKKKKKRGEREKREREREEREEKVGALSHVDDIVICVVVFDDFDVNLVRMGRTPRLLCSPMQQRGSNSYTASLLFPVPLRRGDEAEQSNSLIGSLCQASAMLLPPNDFNFYL
ncbi:hypothetical protein THAOC_12201 [Thalassiosira oceanica]|uniref:Uncharacterized protein n=1 Tax=Thalassiosira oceanica TaxID=159749 RepID=K0SN93_THAOC|nr:hypothetical protein THAOC_12201 [Thalassiosira oceanica]|eukprot:EJK66840.1 hypothetical protein THAOC_12201 [Thalassiosira oceanica]